MLLLIQAYIFGGDDAFLRTKCFGLENGPHYDDELFLSLNAIMIYRRIVKNITQMVLLVKKAVSTDSVCEIGGVGAAAVNGWIPPVSAWSVGMAAVAIGTMIKNIHEEDESTENMRLMCIQEFFKFKSYAAAAAFNK